jgi:hypothetical protein
VQEIKMCANKEMAIDILEFIKSNYEKHLNEDGQAGCQKYIEALQMGIDALNTNISWTSIVERVPSRNEYLTIREDNACYYTRLEIAFQTDTVMYDIGYYDGYKWFTDRHSKIENVIAWRPFIKYKE